MFILALLLAAQAAPDDGPLKLFGDWVVACDNVHRCEMTSLFPGDLPAPDEDSGYDASMSLVREAGPAGGFVVEVSAYHAIKGRVRLKIDGVVLASADARDDTARFTGADAARAAAAMAAGKEAVLIDAAGKPAARISLAGSSAALRYIDAEQGRAGTASAVVARGTKPAAAVPAAPALPRIAALRPAGSPAPVSAALRQRLEKQAECDGMYDGQDVPPVETFALGGGKTLALLPCGSGAYNFNSVAFVLAGGKAERAAFDSGDDAMLVNARFDKGVLSSFEKGRGVGDCGRSQSWVWDGRRFRLIEIRAMDECRGSTNWLATFRATPVFH